MYQRISAIDISVFSLIMCLVLFAIVTLYYLMYRVYRRSNLEDYESRFVEDILDANDYTRLRNKPLFLRRFLQQYAECYNIENATA